ncbi:39164_t:CDS:2 [Gigaspora margarita]|uniref:39164_t:CDS:1 n=1 Tax=Gigaspora margarita TaxID=4874 RepID=A0ABM8VZF9_GIGMA|nr:39164_t:CDS:2 [Gigaspora margarita]
MTEKKKHKMINVEIAELPIHDSKCTKLFVMGSNDCGELGFGNDVSEMKYPKHVESLADFYIVKISCGSLHVAALTQDGKVITLMKVWIYKLIIKLSALGRVTKSEDPNATDENVLALAQGLDDAVIVKVNNSRNIRFTLAINKQSIFMKYDPTSHLKIADIAIGENHVLVLTTNGNYSLLDTWILINLEEEYRYKNFAGGNHSFAVDEDGMLYTWGQNAEGQCGIESLNPIITPMKLEFFENLFRMEQIPAGLYHTLVLLENDDVYSFGSTKYGQLGIGASEENSVYLGFGVTYALRNQRENDELLPFELKCKEFGDIIKLVELAALRNQESAEMNLKLCCYKKLENQEIGVVSLFKMVIKGECGQPPFLLNMYGLKLRCHLGERYSCGILCILSAG